MPALSGESSPFSCVCLGEVSWILGCGGEGQPCLPSSWLVGWLVGLEWNPMLSVSLIYLSTPD